MSGTRVDRPIFVVGVPRSGTTVVFNTFAARRDIAWFTQHLNYLPRWPSVTVLARVTDHFPRARKSILRSDDPLRWREKARIGPVEAYPIWERYAGKRFLYESLIGERPSPEQEARLRSLIAKLVRYQGKDRFATKITGPARIGFLSGAFPDARFIHVIRDGRAVARSLIKVGFWAGTWRERSVAWRGVLGEDELARWRELGEPPLALAALQWQALIRGAREEARRFAPGRYAEIRYEDFVADPHATIDEMTAFCALPGSADPHEFLSRRVEIRDMNSPSFALSDTDGKLLDDLIGEELAELGYGEGAGAGTSGGQRLVRPFADG
ncbi:MAG TPA: sulfotransferase [Solirubrobacterales bacterium]|nr:sulfotransferase [Solirubrobacterales bacterium]